MLSASLTGSHFARPTSKETSKLRDVAMPRPPVAYASRCILYQSRIGVSPVNSLNRVPHFAVSSRTRPCCLTCANENRRDAYSTLSFVSHRNLRAFILPSLAFCEPAVDYYLDREAKKRGESGGAAAENPINCTFGTRVAFGACGTFRGLTSSGCNETSIASFTTWPAFRRHLIAGRGTFLLSARVTLRVSGTGVPLISIPHYLWI